MKADKDQRALLYDCIRGHIVTLRGCKTGSKVIWLLWVHRSISADVELIYIFHLVTEWCAMSYFLIPKLIVLPARILWLLNLIRLSSISTGLFSSTIFAFQSIAIIIALILQQTRPVTVHISKDTLELASAKFSFVAKFILGIKLTNQYSPHTIYHSPLTRALLQSRNISHTFILHFAYNMPGIKLRFLVLLFFVLQIHTAFISFPLEQSFLFCYFISVCIVVAFAVAFALHIVSPPTCFDTDYPTFVV